MKSLFWRLNKIYIVIQLHMSPCDKQDATILPNYLVGLENSSWTPPFLSLGSHPLCAMKRLALITPEISSNLTPYCLAISFPLSIHTWLNCSLILSLSGVFLPLPYCICPQLENRDGVRALPAIPHGTLVTAHDKHKGSVCRTNFHDGPEMNHCSLDPSTQPQTPYFRVPWEARPDMAFFVTCALYCQSCEFT